MSGKLHTYLRRERRRKGLTQRELGFLLGVTSGTVISRLERRKREPNIEQAFACQMIFGVPPHKLFPGMYAKVEKSINHRAGLLVEKVRKGGSRKEKHTFLKTLTSSEEAGCDNLNEQED